MRSLTRAFASRLNILWVLRYWLNRFGASKLKRRLHRLVWVYTCQNATLSEITCHGIFWLCSWKIFLICIFFFFKVSAWKNTQHAFYIISAKAREEDWLPDEPAHHRQTIQLWQFLKQLLLQPNLYNDCIKWVDRTKGVFKIENSSRVAKLWGKRKNRPAMNYDKLSRSIRQYYKKGIIKKPEITKRLVYQFCNNYLWAFRQRGFDLGLRDFVFPCTK